jgi:hypothetical protein
MPVAKNVGYALVLLDIVCLRECHADAVLDATHEMGGWDVHASVYFAESARPSIIVR